MPFPKTGLLAEFTGPAENPLSQGGKWAQTRVTRPPLKKEVGSVTDSIHGDPNYSHWTPETFVGDVEVWGCSVGGQLGAAVETWRVFAFAGLGLASGYQVYFGGGIGKGFAIWKYTNDDFIALAGSGFPGYPSAIGMRIHDGVIEAWGAFGDPFDQNAWSIFCQASDNTYTGPFYIGLAIEDPTSGGLGFTCFGGGTPHRTQFFRWLYN